MCVPRRERFRAVVKLSYSPDTDSPWWVMSKSQQNSNIIFFVHRNDRSEQRFLLYIRQMCFDKILKSAGLFWIRQYLHTFCWSVLCVYICVCVLCVCLSVCMPSVRVCVCVDQLICLLVWKDTIYFLLYFSSVNLFRWFSSVYESILLLYVVRSFLLTLFLSLSPSHSSSVITSGQIDVEDNRRIISIKGTYVCSTNPTSILSSWLRTMGEI